MSEYNIYNYICIVTAGISQGELLHDVTYDGYVAASTPDRNP
jgi:hypothetical protein